MELLSFMVNTVLVFILMIYYTPIQLSQSFDRITIANVKGIANKYNSYFCLAAYSNALFKHYSFHKSFYPATSNFFLFTNSSMEI